MLCVCMPYFTLFYSETMFLVSTISIVIFQPRTFDLWPVNYVLSQLHIIFPVVFWLVCLFIIKMYLANLIFIYVS